MAEAGERSSPGDRTAGHAVGKDMETGAAMDTHMTAAAASAEEACGDDAVVVVVVAGGGAGGGDGDGKTAPATAFHMTCSGTPVLRQPTVMMDAPCRHEGGRGTLVRGRHVPWPRTIRQCGMQRAESCGQRRRSQKMRDVAPGQAVGAPAAVVVAGASACGTLWTRQTFLFSSR